MEDGASYVYRENYERYLPIKFSVKDRDLGTTISELQGKLKASVALDTGYHLEWSGEFGELIEAIDRLEVIIPISFLLIVVLLYAAFNSLRDSLIVLVGIPLTAVGGILALWLTGTVFSVSAAVGFISLLGVAVMAGTIILSPYNAMVDDGVTPMEAVLEVSVMRMRPVLMMCLSACIGLLPSAISTAIGSETQRPLAVVIVGGMFLAPFLILLVMPVVISLIGHRGKASVPSETTEWIEDEDEPGPPPPPSPPTPESPADSRGAHAP
jgi:cobalt-zinc-cadmium resistance protein CzcA